MKKTKKEVAQIIKEQKNILEKIMDDRDNFYKILEEYENVHGFIPEKYKMDIRLMNAYQEYKRIKGWRNEPGIKTIINKSAKIAAKNIIDEANSNSNPLTKQQKIKQLSRKTEEIYKEVEKAEKVLNKK